MMYSIDLQISHSRKFVPISKDPPPLKKNPQKQKTNQTILEVWLHKIRSTIKKNPVVKKLILFFKNVF